MNRISDHRAVWRLKQVSSQQSPEIRIPEILPNTETIRSCTPSHASETRASSLTRDGAGKADGVGEHIAAAHRPSLEWLAHRTTQGEACRSNALVGKK